MRAREKSARSAVPRASPARPVVLLTTEGGASERWADAVVRGLLEVDFVRWSLGPGAANGYPGSPLAGPTPRNVVRSIRQPVWSDPPGVDPWGNGRTARRRRRPSPREVERAFAPLLRAFLEATIDPAGPGERVAAALLDLRDVFRAWEPAVVWRSRGAWEAVRDHLLVRTPDAGGEDIDADGDEVDGWSSEDLPTIGEAAQALSWLGRMLAPLTVEVPRVDLVHAASAGFSAIPGILARVERGTPLLLSEHGVAPREHYLTLRALGAPFHLKRLAADVSGAVARTAYRVADRMAPVTRHTMRWELAYGAPRGRIAVVHPGVDDVAFRPLDVLRSERPTVVQIAPVDREHDPETMLRVAELVRREVPEVMFLHFGEVTEPVTWERIRELRHELELEDVVRFVGPAVDVPRAMALGDVALVTSRSEILPPAVLEASMCAQAVVATDTGGVREALDGGGIVAPVGDAAALADAVAATLRISPDQRDTVRRASREQAAHRFGLRRFLGDVRGLYAGLGVAVLEPGRFVPSDGEVVRVPEAEVPVDIPMAPEGPVALEEPVMIPEADVVAETAAELPPDDVVDAPEPPQEEPVVDHEPEAGGPGVAAEAAILEREPGSTDVRTRLRDPDPTVRVGALRDLDDPRSADAAAAALTDDVPEVRREAARALGRLNGPRAGRWLIDAVTADPSAAVRGEAVDALAALLARPRGGSPEGPAR